LLARFAKPRITEEHRLAEEMAAAARPRELAPDGTFDVGTRHMPDAAE